MIETITTAFKMLLELDFTTGSLMVLGGCLGIVIGVVGLLSSAASFPAQRRKMFEELKR